MSPYHSYSALHIFLRRVAVIVVGTVALPVMLFRHDRPRFYSYLHRCWSKTSNKPVWLAQSESAGGVFF